MFDVAQINDKAVGLVGFQSSDASAPLLESRSGLFFEGGSALVTYANLLSVIPESESPDDTIIGLVQAAYLDLLNRVFSNDDLLCKSLTRPEWEVGEKKAMSGFVGFEVEFGDPDIGLHIGEATIEAGDIPSGKSDVDIYAKTARAIENQMTDKVPLEKDSIGAKGLQWILNPRKFSQKWYVGYFAEDLRNNDGDYNYTYKGSVIDINICSVSIRPIQFPNVSRTEALTPDKLIYMNENPMLGFSFSVRKDYTDYVIRNENAFARGLQLAFAGKALDMFINSTRSNRIERISKAAALFELDGNVSNKDVPKHIGIIDKLNEEVKRLRGLFEIGNITKQTLQ